MFVSPEDRILIEGCLSNNRKDQEALYLKYFDRVLPMCRRYTTDEDALLSIINDGFLKVFKKMHLYKEEGSFEGWIKRLVFNALSDYFRKANRQPKLDDLPKTELEHHDKTLSNLYIDDLDKVINGLPAATREVFILYAIEGYTHAEIGEKLGIAQGTSKWHLSQARSFLQEKIIKHNLNIHYGA